MGANPGPPRRALSEAEIEAMLEQAKCSRDHLFIRVCHATGGRSQEVLGLNIGDVWDGAQVKDTITFRRETMKGKIAPRHVSTNPLLKGALERACKGHDEKAPLFQNDAGKRISRKYMWKMLKQCAEDAGLDAQLISAHSFRKTFLGKVYEATGHDLVATQHAAGHRQVNSTMKYLKPEREKVNKVVINMKV